jgi:hypothetical protein
MTGSLKKTNVTVTTASLTLSHCSEKVNTVFQSVSERQIQFDSTHKMSAFYASNNIQLRHFTNTFDDDDDNICCAMCIIIYLHDK